MTKPSSSQPNLSPDDQAKLLNHNYDGIQELDNPLPRWWVYLFYISVIFSVIYFAYYVLGPGPTLSDELDRKMEKLAANQPKTTEQTPNMDTIDLTDPELIALGKSVYDPKCTACHGAFGEGGIGPNLTDDYWIHGKGDYEGVYKVIYDGVVDKGMLAWGNQLKPNELQAVVAYVLSLKGSNPSNPKAPQGERVE